MFRRCTVCLVTTFHVLEQRVNDTTAKYYCMICDQEMEARKLEEQIAKEKIEAQLLKKRKHDVAARLDAAKTAMEEWRHNEESAPFVPSDPKCAKLAPAPTSEPAPAPTPEPASAALAPTPVLTFGQAHALAFGQAPALMFGQTATLARTTPVGAQARVQTK